MLVASQPINSRFWYPIIDASELSEKPHAIKLFGINIVLWTDAEGLPVAAEDKCVHRFAKLSQGQVVDGEIQCPYHGWRYNNRGQCVAIPQLDEGETPNKNCRLKLFLCRLRYGLVWICIADDPLVDIPQIDEAENSIFRRIGVPTHSWPCGALNAIENIFDNAHHHFVHKQLGDRKHAKPLSFRVLTETETGLYFDVPMRDYSNPNQRAGWGIYDEVYLLERQFTWFTPFSGKLVLHLPNDILNITCIFFTPVSDTESLCNAFILRDDSAEDTCDDDVLTMTQSILEEDIKLLACVDPDVPLDLKEQQHLASDRPSIMMRKRFSRLLKEYNEKECRAHKLISTSSEGAVQ
ncbi:MAG: aromatic ring-hydroxylating dioxygenase subunit alpha [Exilibacterium sp.]